ncbi:GAF domain-containing protein [Streptomyces sp. DSM 41014]|uniref:GAF domain-containing protein n=1 Tax=Streptomyces hintoniae TaxID=3075521 RepID=A0ABU2ULV3_9ACTN|nr:GAF domain-containing protein [Streptomyces sp. DSM 41014]MDT0474258.1 GAF domain-containing protein [Streptomyces sp. DSM 41014]
MRPRHDHGEPGGGRDPAAEAIAGWLWGAAPAEVPERLCLAAVGLLPVTGASVSLYSRGLPVRLGASSRQAARLGDLQATLGDGPCHTAAATRGTVLADDLTRAPDAARWPVFAQQAVEAGVRAVFALPLGTAAVCVGTLDLHRAEPGRLDAAELRTARVLAQVTTAALTGLARDGEPWPGGTHVEIHQATGVVMAQLGISAAPALARLRAHAFAEDRTILDLAHEVMRGRVRFDGEG